MVIIIFDSLYMLMDDEILEYLIATLLKKDNHACLSVTLCNEISEGFGNVIIE